MAHPSDSGGKVVFGGTALHFAASNGKTETVTALVNEFGADVSARDYEDRTALHLAASNGKTETVTALVKECGADVNARDWTRWARIPRKIKHYEHKTLRNSLNLRAGALKRCF